MKPIVAMVLLAEVLGCSRSRLPATEDLFVFGCQGGSLDRCVTDSSAGIWIKGAQRPVLLLDGEVVQNVSWRKTGDGSATKISLAEGAALQLLTVKLAAGPRRVHLVRHRPREDLARNALSSGRFAAAAALLTNAATAHEQERDLFAAVNDLTLAAYIYTQNIRDLTLARKALRRAAGLLHNNAEARFLLHYNRGALANLTGDLKAADRQLQSAIVWAKRIGDDGLLRMSRQVYTETLRQLGKHDRALSLSATLLPTTPSLSCADLHAANNYAWSIIQTSSLRGGRHELSDHSDARQWIRRALADEKNCGQSQPASLQQNLLMNLALVALLDQDFTAATAALKRLDVGSLVDPMLVMWSHQVRGRLAEADRRSKDALTHYRQEARLAHHLGALPNRISALAAQARLLSSQGDMEKANELFEEVHRTIFDQSLWVPLADGRRTVFFGQYRRILFAHLDLLLKRGRVSAAGKVLRRSLRAARVGLHRRRNAEHLSHDQRAQLETHLSTYYRLRDEIADEIGNRWRHAQEQLEEVEHRLAKLESRAQRALGSALAITQPQTNSANLRNPAAGEVILVGAVGYRVSVVFAINKTGTRFHRWTWRTAAAANTSGQIVLAGLPGLLRDTRLLTVVMDPVLQEVDWHSLRIEGVPLARKVGVVYSMDLVPAGDDELQKRRALVVADPNGNLGYARQEGISVARRLQGLGFASVEKLGQGTTSRDVASRFARADVFHYAGHAETDSPGGGRLLLGEKSQLRLTDVLATKRAPKFAVLLGCETGKTEGDLSFAQSLLLRGSRWVAAGWRPLSDDFALAFSDEVYRDDFVKNPTMALTNAVATLSLRFPEEQWAAIRVFVP